MLPADAVVVAPRYVARAEAVAGLGLTTLPGPGGLGQTIKADDSGATDVAGVYAAGNVADMRAQVLHAAAEGSRAAAAINAGLVADDAAMAMRGTGG